MILERNAPQIVGNEWETPQHIYRPLSREFGFMFDAACTRENCRTVEGFYFPEFDALNESWPVGKWIWCNPPYRPIRPWIEKVQEQAQTGCQIALLIPAMGFGNKYLSEWLPAEIRFYIGRIKFLLEGTPQTGNTRDSALLIFDGARRVHEPRCKWVKQSDG